MKLGFCPDYAHFYMPTGKREMKFSGKSYFHIIH